MGGNTLVRCSTTKLAAPESGAEPISAFFLVEWVKDLMNIRDF